MEKDKDTLYARWLAGELSSEEEEDLVASGDIEELEAIIKATDQLSLPKYDAEAGFAKFKTNQASKKEASIHHLPTSKNRRWLAVAASLLILVAVGLWLFQGTATIETGNQMTLTHRFEDQTVVVLNDGSKLSYDKASWDLQRTVELTGEAVFTVQTGTPFSVKTPNGTVEVLGTSFNVRTWGDKLHVECYEGKVRVFNKNQETLLTKNQAVNVVKGQFQPSTINHQKPLWTTGNSRFYEENLNQVFEELERQYGVEVEAPSLNRPFSGNFKHDDLETALRAICLPMNLAFTIDTEQQSVLIKSK